MGQLLRQICCFIVFVAPLVEAQDIYSCVSSVTAPCTSLTNQTIEEPYGAIDGINTTFTLSYPPIASADVRVAINGVRLSNGKDFKVDGQLLTIAAGYAPHKESVFRVAYQTQFQSQPTTSPSSRSTNNVDAIVRAALMHALESESVMINARLSSQPSQPESTPSSANPYIRGSRSRALLLLSQRLEDAANTRPSSLPMVTLTNVQGAEGLGDQPSITPYSILFGSSSQRLFDTDDLSNEYRGIRPIQNRSLIMLEQRLYASGKTTSTKSRK